MEIDKIFFELIRVAIGTQICLSRQPSNKEWKALYDTAKKQSLVGVSFAALQRLGADANEGYTRIGMSEILYLTWMGMAAKIQQKNQTVDEQCVALQKRLAADGFRSCVLKGQGVAQLYGMLSGLRQSGDIDIWVDGKMEYILDWMKKLGVKLGDIDSVHVPAEFFEDTEVEVHFRPSYMYNPTAERLLMDFFEKNAIEQFENIDQSVGFTYPTVAFNLIFSLVHINRHIYSEGIGLRQLMDYFMILQASSSDERKAAFELMRKMYLGRFISGVMYIEQKIFGLSADKMLCYADEKEGEFLLQEIMIGGNFGHYDERNSNLPKSMRWLRGLWTLKRMMRYLTHYPHEVLSIPVWKLKHYLWRKKNGYI